MQQKALQKSVADLHVLFAHALTGGDISACDPPIDHLDAVTRKTERYGGSFRTVQQGGSAYCCTISGRRIHPSGRISQGRDLGIPAATWGHAGTVLHLSPV